LAIIFGACAVFTAIGFAMAYDAKTPLERWLGIAYAFLFAGCGVALAANALLNRGPRAAPSAPLRIGADGQKRLDRLDLFASPARLLVVGGAALLFILAGFIIPIFKPDVVGSIVGVTSACLGASAIASTFVLASSRRPLISIGLDSLEYRTPFPPARAPATPPHAAVDRYAMGVTHRGPDVGGPAHGLDRRVRRRIS
jgi:hypothetical protein